MPLYLELNEKRKERSADIERLNARIFKENIKYNIVSDNIRFALFNEAYPVIVKAFEPYAGKPYGERTKDKIREEVKKAGFWFYFGGYGDNRIEISLYNSPYVNIECTAYALSLDNAHNAQFIDNDNRVNIQNVKPSIYGHYVDNVNARANEIIKALNAFYKAQEAFENASNALNGVLPYKTPAPKYFEKYNLTFSRRVK